MKGIFYEEKKQSLQLSSPLPDVTEHQEKKLKAEILMKPVDVSHIKIPSNI